MAALIVRQRILAKLTLEELTLVTGSDNTAYEEFQGCLSAAEDREGERLPTEEEVRDCFESIYTGKISTETESLDDTEESGVDGPVLH